MSRLVYALVLIMFLSCKQQRYYEDIKDKNTSTPAGIYAAYNDAEPFFSFLAFSKIIFSDIANKVEVRINPNNISEDNVFFLVNYENTYGDTTAAKVQRILHDNCCSPEIIELVVSQGNKYLYFELYMPGGSMWNYGHELILLNLQSMEVYSYKVQVVPDSWFIRTISINGSDNLFDEFPTYYLYHKLTSLQNRLKLDDFEQNRFDFYLKNREALNQIFFGNVSHVKLQFVKTKNSIFKINEENTSNTSLSAENSRYFVLPFFRQGVHCFDKHTNEYFCIWLPTDYYNNPYTLHFKDLHTLVMTGPEHNVTINLLNGIAKLNTK